MRITRIDFEGKPGRYATCQRCVGGVATANDLVVTILTADQPNGREHHVQPDCEEDGGSLDRSAEVAAIALRKAAEALREGPAEAETLVVGAEPDCGILQSEGSQTVTDLAKRVADEMYYGELSNGAWAVDIGIWGPSLFNRDALALLDAMTDRCLAVEGENDK